MKVLFGLPLRQTTGLVESLLRLSCLDWPVPDYTTLCRRQKHLQVQIPYRAASGPLHLLVDSTGIKFSGDGDGKSASMGPVAAGLAMALGPVADMARGV